MYTKPTRREEALLKTTEILAEVIRAGVESDIPLMGFLDKPYLASEAQLRLVVNDLRSLSDIVSHRIQITPEMEYEAALTLKCVEAVRELAEHYLDRKTKEDQ